MSINIANQVSYLRTSRNFPSDIQALVVEVNKSYVDIANAVNNRIISLFPTNRSAITGESWFLSGNQRQQALRQVYQFTGSGNIPHGLNFSSISFFTKPFGSYTDGTNYYGAIYSSNTGITGQITFYVDSTNIVVTVDAAAPTITSGIIVLEWTSNF